MASRRKTISKKTRFEVFKRDSFTCQYCGERAPNVVLVVDHIHPVSKGGQNDILNLVTSCEGCNQGKSDRALSDSSVVSKRMTQAAALQARLDQIEMISEWQRSLVEIDAKALSEATEYYSRVVPGWELNANGIADTRKYLAKYGFEAVVSEFRKAAAAHVRISTEGRATEESAKIVNKVAFNSLRYKELNQRDPVGSAALYAAAIARNRLHNVPWSNRTIFVEWAKIGVPVDFLRTVAATSTSWTSLCSQVDEFIEENINAG